jgi:hypothetical protein
MPSSDVSIFQEGLGWQIAGVAGVIGLPLGEAVGSAHGWGHRLPDPEALRKEPS